MLPEAAAEQSVGNLVGSDPRRGDLRARRPRARPHPAPRDRRARLRDVSSEGRWRDSTVRVDPVSASPAPRMRGCPTATPSTTSSPQTRPIPEGFDLGGLEPVAAKGLAVLTCIDSRIAPLAMLGLEPGDAKKSSATPARG